MVLCVCLRAHAQLLVQPQRYLFLYAILTVLCTILLVAGDFAYSDSTTLFAFMLSYRLMTVRRAFVLI
jgi:hypothetical protein